MVFSISHKGHSSLPVSLQKSQSHSWLLPVFPIQSIHHKMETLVFTSISLFCIAVINLMNHPAFAHPLPTPPSSILNAQKEGSLWHESQTRPFLYPKSTNGLHFTQSRSQSPYRVMHYCCPHWTLPKVFPLNSVLFFKGAKKPSSSCLRTFALASLVTSNAVYSVICMAHSLVSLWFLLN